MDIFELLQFHANYNWLFHACSIADQFCFTLMFFEDYLFIFDMTLKDLIDLPSPYLKLINDPLVGQFLIMLLYSTSIILYISLSSSAETGVIYDGSVLKASL